MSSNFRILRSLLFIPFLSLGLLSQSPVIYSSDWPSIRPFNVTVSINMSDEKIHFSIPILNTKGSIVYRISCHGGSQSYCDEELEDLLGSNFVSPMCFFMSDASKPSTLGPLLAEDGSAHWHTRAQVHFSDLIGLCGDYPEFGRLRHFRVRGMAITIHFQQVDLDANGQPSQLQVNISGDHDPTATCSYVEVPDYLHPRGDCAHVKKGKEPRMFRNKLGNWVEENKLQNPK